MDRVRDIRGNKSQSILEITIWKYVWRWSRQVSGIGGDFLPKSMAYIFWSPLTLSESKTVKGILLYYNSRLKWRHTY